MRCLRKWCPLCCHMTVNLPLDSIWKSCNELQG